ncbi:pseudouridine synthase [Acidiferrobacter sp.]|jgi:23S rRNA pseudouridine2604 synthase|uniref:pseudouridine synthase n=1 Tax=Acidiferrobacter sp. TaxID=1872107 RepID=UPI00261769A7|nr:pseudouridine synthase [Acidiferrobacter sp.]
MTDALVRISKLLASRGVCSRREADHYLEQGLVEVDGHRAVIGERAAPDARITLAPGARARQERRVTILLNKPLGYVSGQPEKGYQSAHVLLTPGSYVGPAPPPRVPQGLAVAGRLDIDSQGLLVLTEDGRVARLLIGDHVVEKEYHVRVAAPISDATLATLRGPLVLDDRPLRPVRVDRLGPDALIMILTEGRKRQIRRMLQQVGHEVRALKRVRIGRVRLGGLKPGQWRALAPGERF